MGWIKRFFSKRQEKSKPSPLNQSGHSNGLAPEDQNPGNLEDRLEEALTQKVRQDAQDALRRQMEQENIDEDRKRRTKELEKLAEKYTMPLAVKFNQLKPFNGKGEITQSVELKGDYANGQFYQRDVIRTQIRLSLDSQDYAFQFQFYLLSFEIAQNGMISVNRHSFSNGRCIEVSISENNWKNEVENRALKSIVDNEIFQKDSVVIGPD